ncbi:hypothetical protein OQ279_14945 [Salinimicrobium sp. MT39]|uniref:Polymer-forming cytoskeletal protein n=1 Tax=Salinimicrobium profundisediminis TaxID=2994553 RepID=A0A9X3CYT6_9FLAO|nr:hypothetical protein [Salinimicrobium profundisediminis]MCX2839446.1 hypothetical protein [Salinimicrobium profundisediminis]
MKSGHKIRASAMQFALLVSVIVALLLSAFLLFTHTYSSFSVRSDQVLRNINASNKGIEYLAKADLQLTDSLEILIQEIPVLVKNSFWGCFQLAHSRGGSGSTSFQKVALLGAGTGGEKISLFLEDNLLPLVVAGNTRIEGDAFTSQDIIKPGSIAGHYYAGDQLVYGRRFESPSELPELNPEWRFYVQNMLKFIPEAGAIVIGLEDRTNSFFNERQVIYQEDKIEINESLSGNILIISLREIEVTPFAKLDQVLLVAPKVLFRSGFRGNVHVIAEEAVLQENVKLNYPSSIVVSAKEEVEINPESSYKPKIEIGEHSVLEGNLVFLDASEETNPKLDLLLAENSFVEGTIYCEGYTDIRGKVLGSLYTKYCVANRGGSLYINHIYNGRILTNGMKQEMSGLVMDGQEKKVAAWLY